MIAKVLIQYENPNNIYYADPKENWYKYIWQNYIFSRKVEDLSNLNISFITFNYDRSLEYFLFNAIKATYGKEDNDVKGIINRFNLTHLYGSLGQLPWGDEGGCEYSNKEDGRRYISCIDTLHIIPDTERDKAFQKARALIEKAKYIIFLGFGFDDENIKRLDISTMVGKQIYATCYGYTSEEQNKITSKFTSKSGIQIITKPFHNLEFLRKLLPNLA
jgi:hypothetical protein